LGAGSAPDVRDKRIGDARVGLTGVEGEREFAEQGLPGPARGQMNPDATRSLTNASADFEEPGAESFDLYRAPRFRQLQKTKQIDQVVGEGMQQQPEGVGQKAVAAQAVGAETVLEFFDAVLAFTAVVVKSEDLGSSARDIGDQEAQIGSDGGVFGLVADVSLARPGARAVAKAREAALRELRATITALQFFLQRLGAVLKNAIGGNAQCVLDSEELAELIEQRQGKASVTTQLDAHAGKGALQARNDPQQHGHDAGVTGSIARSQTHAQQASGVALENQHGMVHVLIVGAVEETELLLAVRRIVSGIDVQQNLAALADLPAAETNELI